MKTQGKVEAADKTIKNILLKMTLEAGTADFLDEATNIYNNKEHSSIGMTPFEALIGQKKRLTSTFRGSAKKDSLSTEALPYSWREPGRKC